MEGEMFEIDAEAIDLRAIMWQTASHPVDLLECVESQRNGRKWRLFMCACARRVLDLAPQDACRAVLTIAEDYADGDAAHEDMIEMAQAASTPTRVIDGESIRRGALTARRIVVDVASMGESLLQVVTSMIGETIGIRAEREQETSALCALVRDIFGNPFRSSAFSPSWRTDTALALATQMYESREFSAMPILADALQDAGCDNDDILSHCRDTSQVHVRGCWVVDLVLGKA
jgi:hypothetical protein